MTVIRDLENSSLTMTPSVRFSIHTRLACLASQIFKNAGEVLLEEIGLPCNKAKGCATPTHLNSRAYSETVGSCRESARFNNP